MPPNDLLFEISKPNALLAGCATILDISIRSKCSVNTIPRYLYSSTNSKEEFSHTKLNSVLTRLTALKCTTLDLSKLIIKPQVLHHLFKQSNIVCILSSSSESNTMSSAYNKIET